MRGLFNNLADAGGSFWLPPQASSYAADSDWLFWFVMWICVFFFFLVAALVVIFAWKYRYRPGAPVRDAPKHNTALELTWTFIPTVIVVIIFFFGFKGYLTMAVPPPNPYEMVVYGSMWKWQFQYPDGHMDDELHLPQGVPVQFVLTSNDVIHGFFIPSFRVKKDVVPGRYNRIWAQASQPGMYDIYCTQYCGDGHSTMRAKLYVTSKKDFDVWLKQKEDEDNNPSVPPAEHGHMLYKKLGCINCHTIDGSANTGPSWKNVFGHEIRFADGSSEVADENYLRSMITNPNNKIVAGYQPVMPSFQGQLRDKTHDVDHLIAFIKSLSDKGPSTATTRP